MTLRFAVWAAVSSIEQVEAKNKRTGEIEKQNSLDNQVAKCVERAKSEGWKDTGLRFVADGYSRTGYSGLEPAMENIPPLADCVRAMRDNSWDLLVMANFDRMGDLIVMLANEARNYRKQLYSVNQPTKVFENYDPYGDDSSYIMQILAPLWQRQRISDLRRKLRENLPTRLENGLTPLSIPFGYRWRGKREVPDPVPSELQLVIQMRDALMRGATISSIKRMCDASGIASPRGRTAWDATTIVNILRNPYYSGQVVLYKSQVVFDPSRKHNARQVQQPRSKWLVRPGRHLAIMSPDEHDQVIREMDRRRELNLRVSLRFPLSGLLYCAVCDRKIYRHSHHNASAGGSSRILTCNRRGPSHIIWEYDQAVPAIAGELQAFCRKLPIQSPSGPASTLDLAAVMDDLAARRIRVQESAELGVFTPAEAAEKVAALERQAEDVQARIEAEATQAATRADFLQQLSGQMDYMAEWITDDDPQIVNRLLSSLLRRIVISPDRSVAFELR